VTPVTRGAVASLLATLVACGGFVDRQAASSTLKILRASQTAARRQPDVELARAALPGGIIQLEAFAIAYPDHREFKVLHAESVCQYATAFVFDDLEDAQLRGDDGAVAHIAPRLGTLLTTCERAQLALAPPAWLAARTDRRTWAKVIASSSATHASVLRWLGTADAVRVAIDPLRNLERFGLALAALERVAALRPGLHDADAELLLGTLYAGRSAVFGGPDGRAWFDKARAHLGEGALLVDVMFARGVLVARKDRTAFTTQLERVLAADLSKWPERRLANELAVHKARRYLVATDRLIPPAAPP
jgi:hypothetical protein